VSDSGTLIAGILLTSFGLLALLPYVLKRGWRDSSAVLALGWQLTTAGVSAFESESGEADPCIAVAPEDIDGLLAHLFSLRMSVSEVTAEVHEVHNALRTGNGDSDDASGGAVAAEDVA
jgi:hypothetical protein